MSQPHDVTAPPPDLDVLAARQAERTYRAAVGRGLPNWQAWEEAVSVFAGYHPAWPMPLVEREASRTVGAMVMQEVTAQAVAVGKAKRRQLPLDLLVDLVTPESAESMRAKMRVEEMGLGAVSVFRGAWKLCGNVRPVAQMPVRQLPATGAAVHA